jgi:serine/threonine protein kinase
MPHMADVSTAPTAAPPLVLPAAAYASLFLETGTAPVGAKGVRGWRA